MINLKKFKRKNYCCEDISLIENYEQAINDKTHHYDCHHKLEIHEDYQNTSDELKMMGLYYNRPACELIFLTHGDHTKLHNNLKVRLGVHNSLKGLMRGHKRPDVSERNRKYNESRRGVPTCEFSRKYKEHYGALECGSKRYKREWNFHRKYGKCSWE